MRIAVGGLNKNETEAAIKKADPSIEVVVTNDMQGAQMIKSGKVDYYIGACNSGGGGSPSFEEIKKFVDEGKLVFGTTVDTIDTTVPLLVRALVEKSE